MSALHGAGIVHGAPDARVNIIVTPATSGHDDRAWIGNSRVGFRDIGYGGDRCLRRIASLLQMDEVLG